MDSGEVIIKLQQQILTNDIILTIKPEEFPAEGLASGIFDYGEVTCFHHCQVQKDLLIIGTAASFVMVYDLEKRENVKIYKLEDETSKIEQIESLP